MFRIWISQASHRILRYLYFAVRAVCARYWPNLCQKSPCDEDYSAAGHVLRCHAGRCSSFAGRYLVFFGWQAAAKGE